MFRELLFLLTTYFSFRYPRYKLLSFAYLYTVCSFTYFIIYFHDMETVPVLMITVKRILLLRQKKLLLLNNNIKPKFKKNPHSLALLNVSPALCSALLYLYYFEGKRRIFMCIIGWLFKW